MAESENHQKLIDIIVSKVKTIVNDSTFCMILIDNPSVKFSSYPEKTLDGYRPDVYYNYNNLLIIGEAKTQNDIDRKHSIDQYISYLKLCNTFQGESYFILGVNWIDTPFAKSLIKNLIKKFDIRTNFIIVDDLYLIGEKNAKN